MYQYTILTDIPEIQTKYPHSVHSIGNIIATILELI